MKQTQFESEGIIGQVGSDFREKSADAKPSAGAGDCPGSMFHRSENELGLRTLGGRAGNSRSIAGVVRGTAFRGSGPGWGKFINI